MDNASLSLPTRRTLSSFLHGSVILAAYILLAPAKLQAQVPPQVRLAAGLLDVGGYFPVDRSARSAIGDVKFYSETSIFARPRNIGGLQLSGGAQMISAKDHFLPFSGGNQFSLFGPVFRVATPRLLGTPRFVLTGGVFAGRVRSERLGFDRTEFTPGAALGVEYPFARYVTLIARYHVSQRIHGVNTDGLSVSLKLF